MNILFVCRGNLCRSPLAEALLKKKFADFRINGEVDSAGFESFHINEPPHAKAQEVSEKHGIELSGMARLFMKNDFIRFDKIYVMDALSYQDVMELAKTKKNQRKVDYLMNVLAPGKNKFIPDPIAGGIESCDSVFDLLDEITDIIIDQLK